MSERRDWLGVPLAQARLLRVTARLQQGAVLDPRWPLPLDGILASASRRARHGEQHGGVRDLHAEDLPLARSLMSWHAGARWFWLASCAVPDPGCLEELHYWHRRIPHAAAERVTGSRLPPQIYEGHGRYRAYRMPLVTTVTAALTWLACGDPDGVRGLLAGVWAAGRKRSQGEGAVLGWDVDDLGEPDAEAVIWRQDGLIGRPVPARCAPALGLASRETVAGCYRPPYWRPAQDNTAGPFARQWQEVIAPWTTRPSTLPSSPQSAAAAAVPSRPGS